MISRLRAGFLAASRRAVAVGRDTVDGFFGVGFDG